MSGPDAVRQASASRQSVPSEWRFADARQLGESVVEATVARWLKQEGEPVEAGDAVVELETDKVNVEVAADGAGVLTKIAAPRGGDRAGG